MPLTAEEMVAATACRRMLEDEQFNAVLNAIVEESAERAMFLDRPEDREAYRLRVVTVARIRQEILARAQLPEVDAAEAALARSME